jgi:two-component system, chemotaxis family, sensor kinase CheA
MVSAFSGLCTNGPIADPDVRVPAESMYLADDFVGSASSKLEQLEAVALEIEEDNYYEQSAAAKRILHSIKGEAAMLHLYDIRDICHEAESALDVLDFVEAGDMLLRVKDWLFIALEQIEG